MIRLKRLFAHDFKQLREVELKFPETGRILVQGKNEAGKSTLFESIFFALFGQALATESVGRQNLDDLIGYEKNKARVELELAARDRIFRITRTLNRGKANVWELDIINGDLLEEIKGNRAVNDRLIAELGFDGEALLNTCFVEQKKLEKLEGMTKTKREESFSKLLNLERLLDLEEDLRIRSEDDKMLSRLSNRVELAQAQQDLPEAEAELTKAEGQLKLIELRTQVIRALDERNQESGLQKQLVELQTRRDGLRSAAIAVEALDKARRSMANALDRFDLLSQQTKSLDDLRRERGDTQRAAHENVPLLEQRLRRLVQLARGLARLQRIRDWQTAALTQLQNMRAVQEELKGTEQRIAELDASIAQLEARASRIEPMLLQYDLGEALGLWASAAREAGAGASADRAVEELSRTHERLSNRLRLDMIGSGLTLLLFLGATILIPILVYYWTRSLLLSLGVAVLESAVDTILVGFLVRRGLGLWQELEGATAQLGKAQGESAARREIDQGRRDRLSASGARLVELGVPLPPSPEAAEAHRVEIAASFEYKSRAELIAERETMLERLNYARAQRDEVRKQVAQIQAAAPAEAINRCHRIAERAGTAVNRWQPVLAARAAELEIEPEMQAVRDSKLETESQLKTWKARILQVDKLGGQIVAGEARSKKISDELHAAYDSARSLVGSDVPPWNAALDRASYSALGEKLSGAFDAHGGDQVRTGLNAVEKEIGACEQALKHRAQAGQNATTAAREILGDLGIEGSLGPQASVDELAALAARLEKVELEDKPRLEGRVRTLQMQVGALRGTRDRLERELGLADEGIDLEAARQELANERQAQEERRYGAEIVLRARKRIVQKVLPATMDYMRRILPQLTRDRYHDSDLDPETYKIKVWDERAGQSGAWKEKNIFSGGTKDQFSLALRLAFALATLPQERGTSPGFIFLDEPLGSFDDERAAALLYLLTEGEIARAFDQIFLISHVRVKEDLFTHQVRLENGAVVESSL